VFFLLSDIVFAKTGNKSIIQGNNACYPSVCARDNKRQHGDCARRSKSEKVGKEMKTTKSVEPWGDPNTATILVIGHDPRLLKSSAVAKHAFFINIFANLSASLKFSTDGRKHGLFLAFFSIVRVLFCQWEVFLDFGEGIVYGIS
jgi:hypothetical protein